MSQPTLVQICILVYLLQVPYLLRYGKKLAHNPEESCSVAIRAVKQAIANDLDTQYEDPDVCMLMNKSTLLDSRLKSLAHLTEYVHYLVSM